MSSGGGLAAPAAGDGGSAVSVNVPSVVSPPCAPRRDAVALDVSSVWIDTDGVEIEMLRSPVKDDPSLSLSSVCTSVGSQLGSQLGVAGSGGSHAAESSSVIMICCRGLLGDVHARVITGSCGELTGDGVGYIIVTAFSTLGESCGKVPLANALWREPALFVERCSLTGDSRAWRGEPFGRLRVTVSGSGAGGG